MNVRNKKDKREWTHEDWVRDRMKWRVAMATIAVVLYGIVRLVEWLIK